METQTQAPAVEAPRPGAFAVALPQFEGPLDLLLSLIQEHKLDIFDVPIAFLTEKYLEYIEEARALDLDIAGEYLLMAATLAHIKSRLLLPREDAAEADIAEIGPDPREELIRRLLEYQKYKTAAQDLASLPQLGRDTFTRRAKEELPLSAEEGQLVADDRMLRPAGSARRPGDPAASDELSVYRVIEALADVLDRRKIDIPHEVFVERLSIGDRIAVITDRLRAEERITFTSLFDDLAGHGDRHRVVPTFLAVLEMTKLKLVRVHQPDVHGEIYLARTDALLDTGAEGATLDYRG